jgi:hypothetical protein
MYFIYIFKLLNMLIIYMLQFNSIGHWIHFLITFGHSIQHNIKYVFLAL